MSDGFKRVPSIFTAEPGKTPLDIPKKKKQPFVSALGKSTKVLNDTVKYSSEVAKRSFSGSIANVQKASRAVAATPIKFARRRTKSSPEEDTIEKKVERLFDTQDLLFERLDSEPKLSMAMKKSLSTIKIASKASARYVHKQPLLAKVITITVISLAAGGVSYISGGSMPTGSVNEVAGVTDTQPVSTESQTIDPSTIQKTTPSFDVILPKGKEQDDFEYVKVSPEGNEPVYAYLDTVGGEQVRVSQQVLPEVFKTNSDAELEKLAKNFQATDIIQVDDIRIYHGVSDKLKTQSLVFIKNKRLVFIASPIKQNDDIWAAYVLALQ